MTYQQIVAVCTVIVALMIGMMIGMMIIVRRADKRLEGIRKADEEYQRAVYRYLMRGRGR